MSADVPAPRRPRGDLLAPVWWLVTLVVYAVHGFSGAITRDSSFYVYAGQQVAEGAAPYEELMNRAGPLAHVLPAFGVWLGDLVGVDDVYGVRLVFFLLSALAVPLTYAVARDAFASRWAGSAAAAAMLGFVGYAAFATTGPQSKSPIAAMLALALLLTLRRQWLAAGVVAGIGTLTWQPMLFAAGPAALAGVLLMPEGRWRAVLRYAVGGLLTLAAMAAWFAARGLLQLFWDGFVLANARYTRQPGVWDGPGEAWALLVDGYGWSAVVVLGGTVLMLVIGVRALRRRGGDATDAQVRASTLVVTAGLLGGVVWTYLVFNGWADAFMLLPLSALGVGALAGLLDRRGSTDDGRRILGALRVVVLAWSVGVAGVTAWTMWDTRSDELERQIASSEVLFDLLPAGSTALSIEAPQPLALTGTDSISRFQLFTNGMEDYVEDRWDGGMDGYVAWVREQRPTAVSVEEVSPDWLWGEVSEDYVRVGRMTGAELYLHSSVDAGVVGELRDALAPLEPDDE